MSGVILKDYRKRLKLTQAQLANILGYSRDKTIAEYESGTRQVPDFIMTLIMRDINPLNHSVVQFLKLFGVVLEAMDKLRKDEDQKAKELYSLLNEMYERLKVMDSFKDLVAR